MNKVVRIGIYINHISDGAADVFNMCKSICDKGFTFSRIWNTLSCRDYDVAVLGTDKSDDIVGIVAEMNDFLDEWGYSFIDPDFFNIEDGASNGPEEYSDAFNKRNWKLKELFVDEKVNNFFYFDVEINESFQ